MSQDIPLSFDTPQRLFCAGLRWEENAGVKDSLFRLFATHREHDLDLCCLLLDEKMEPIDLIRPRGNREGAYYLQIMHTGDQNRGDTCYDDEEIRINLSTLVPHVHSILFIVDSANGHDFQSISKAACHFADGGGAHRRFLSVRLEEHHDGDAADANDRVFAAALLKRLPPGADGHDQWVLRPVLKYAGVPGLKGKEKEVLASLAL